MLEEKPPLGIKPESVFLQKRAEGLAEAILRYVYFANYETANQNILAWSDELRRIVVSMQERDLTKRSPDSLTAEAICPRCCMISMLPCLPRAANANR